MTRPVHIDRLIQERILPQDVVKYIGELESWINEQQEMLEQADSMYLDLLLEREDK